MLNQNLLLTGDDGYNLTNSLRFRSSASAYLNRTPASASNRKTWTWSGWVKRGALNSGELNYLFMAGVSGNETVLTFASNDAGVGNNDTLCLYHYFGAGFVWQKTTAQLFRDVSAWYHIVAVLDTDNATAEDRARLYVNGTRVTSWQISTNPSSGYSSSRVNDTTEHDIGKANFTNRRFDGYMTEINFIDGQALTPSSFGETDVLTGVWKPKKYAGTYGTNGFYLPFTDNSALTTSSNVGLGKDFSGNSNYWTTNNISITAGTTYDSMTDVPTLTSATTANYCVLNPLGGSTNTIQNGNLQLTGTAAGNTSRVGSLAVSSGKWYFETTITTLPSGQDPLVGISNVNSSNLFTTYPGEASTSYSVYLYQSNSFIQKVNNNTFTNTSATTIAQGDVIGVALDLDNGKIWFSKNGTFVDSGSPTGGTNAQFTGLSGSFVPALRGTGGASTTTLSPNFGQQPFAYTPPTGFVALNTFNLPTPTIGATASNRASKHFNVGTYTGTGSASALAVVGADTPDLVWIKGRSGASSHSLLDKLRDSADPFSLRLYSNATNAEYDYGSSLLTPTSTGFNLTTSDADHNTNTGTYVAWSWKANGAAVTNTAGSISAQVSANPTAGFSVVTYTGNGTSGATVGHGLNAPIKMLICKQRNGGTYGWNSWHTSLSTNYYIALNSTGGQDNSVSIWNTAGMTSSVFTHGSDTIYMNNSGSTYVAYCFAEVAGYSKFGSYTGNGSSDGPFVFTGFRPRFVMIKRTDGADSWRVMDSTRSPYNAVRELLLPDTSGAESSAADWLDFVSNGFKLRFVSSGQNANGGTYIYMAFAENPTKFALAR